MQYYLFLFNLLIFSLVSVAETTEQTKLQTVVAKNEETYQRRILNGIVEAVHQATVSAQTSGRVSEIYYDVGDYVPKNNVLLRIRSETQQAKMSAAQAKFKREKAEYERARVMYQKKLFAKTDLDKAKADFSLADAELKQAQEDMERTEVRAPYAGIVVKRHIEVGETASEGQKLMTGLSLESLRVVVEVPQSLIKAVRKFQKAQVKLNGEMTTITKFIISPYADPKSHSFTVKGDIPQSDNIIYPGMYVKIEFITGRTKKLTVPSDAIIRRSEVTALYVIDDTGTISMRQVRVGETLPEGKTEILGGLDEGERVATDPIMASTLLKSTDYNQK